MERRLAYGENSDRVRQMKKILIIHHGQGVGGGLIALLSLIEQLKLQYFVTVFCIFDSVAVQVLRRDGCEVIVAESPFYKRRYDLFVHSDASFPSLLGELRKLSGLFLYLVNALIFAPATLRDIAADYDIVYLNSVFVTDWARAAKRLGKKVVVHVREPLSKGFLGMRRALIRAVTRRYADLVIAISEDNKRRIDLPGNTVRVYDSVYLSPVSINQISVDPQLRYFAYVGGSQRIKGFEQLIDCLPYLNENIRIFFLGYDHELQGLTGWKFAIRKALSSYSRRLPALRDLLRASDQVVRVGISSDVFSYYKVSIALISPFAAPHASLPIMECLYLGKPVIASDVSGTEELVSSGTGKIFRNGNAKALAAAINDMAALDQHTLDKMSAACQTKFATICASNPSVVELLGAI